MQQATTRPLALPNTPRNAGPGLVVEVDGRRVTASSVTPRGPGVAQHLFVIGPRAGQVRLVSRTAIPAACDATSMDQRRLGVAVRRIVLRGGVLELNLPHDDPSLDEGFHPSEAGHRWTNGAGVIPTQWLRALQEGFEIEIETSESELTYLTSG